MQGWILSLGPFLAALGAADVPDDLRIRRDDAKVRQSATLRIEELLPDGGEVGVVHIDADDVVVDFAGSELRGAEPGTPPDGYTGVGVVISGQRVTVRNARVSGYRCGILARSADGLVLEDCDVSDNFRQRLGSTPEAEDPADWLRPHHNDAEEWLEQYGAGIWVSRSRDVTVRRCRARDGQNGLVLDRVEDSRVYDNDFSFLSGWGVALWRSSRNVLSRNALDFCVRGYSHGVYNRGQDSAGILFFEQCSENLVAENSVTHGGDGFFGFAGAEALGEVAPPTDDFDYAGRGSNGNVLRGNDFSYAAAHGIEMTFGFDNVYAENRIVGNAICGVWGGYSVGTKILSNEIAANGDAGYGLERGGINIEHGRDTFVGDNRIDDNACGVHFWWDPDEHLAQLPWVRANGAACEDNHVTGNEFRRNAIGIHVRGGGAFLRGGNLHENLGEDVRDERTAAARALDPSERPDGRPAPPALGLEALGATRPVGAREHLRGREHMVIGEWGPHDWSSPRLVRVDRGASVHTWRLLGAGSLDEFALQGEGAVARRVERDGLALIEVSPAAAPACAAYRLTALSGDDEVAVDGLLVAARWSVIAFPFTVDPREDAAAWAAEARVGATRFVVDELTFRFGNDGYSQVEGVPASVAGAGLPRDRFGTIAAAQVALPAGRWRVATTSDDGIRVRVGQDTLIDDWTIHGTTRHEAEFDWAGEGAAVIVVQHYEWDGAAELTLALTPSR